MTTAEPTHVTLQHPDRFWIGGEWVAPSTDAMFDVIEPSTEERLLQVAEATEADVARAVTAARRAFDDGPWPRLTHAERAVHLRAIGDAIRARSDELSRIWTSEAGVLHAIARAFTPGVAGTWDYYAGLAEDF